MSTQNAAHKCLQQLFSYLSKIGIYQDVHYSAIKRNEL